jgi:hypothetical protein
MISLGRIIASRAIPRQTTTASRHDHARAPHVLRAAATVVVNIAAIMVLVQAYKLVRKTFIQRVESVGFDHAR